MGRGGAQSYFLAGIESRVLEIFMMFCMGCSTGDAVSAVEHMSLQYDGSEVLMPQPPDNSTSLAQDAIFCRIG